MGGFCGEMEQRLAFAGQGAGFGVQQVRQEFAAAGGNTFDELLAIQSFDGTGIVATDETSATGVVECVHFTTPFCNKVHAWNKDNLDIVTNSNENV